MTNEQKQRPPFPWGQMLTSTLAAAALVVALVVAFGGGPGVGGDVQQLGVTNLDSLHLSDTGGTATPVFIANQDGTGAIAEFQDGGTPVARIPDGGGLSMLVGVPDFDNGFTYGSGPLYPVGNAGSNVEIACGTTGTFTGSTTIDVTAMSVVSQVVAMQVTAPITTAAFLYVTDPATTTFTLTSLTGGATAPFAAGTTGITAHYCAIGSD